MKHSQPQSGGQGDSSGQRPKKRGAAKGPVIDYRSAAKAEPPPPAPHTPLKRRPKVFVWLLAFTLVWLIALLILFFTTVYPYRGHQVIPGPTPAKPR